MDKAKPDKRLIIVYPHGFCVGVDRAVRAAETAVAEFGTPLYCHNEIVHNEQVVTSLRKKGVVFVTAVSEVPEGATLLLSAHGVPPQVKAEAARRGLNLIDATCPFVSKVHSEVKRFARDGYTVLLVGYRKHDEVIGVAGEAPEHVIVVEDSGEARSVAVVRPDRVAVVTQTTLSIDDANGVIDVLRSRFPSLVTPAESDICYATQNRQGAVRQLAGRCDLVLVLGSRNSSNSRRLTEVASAAGCRAVLVSHVNELDALPLEDSHVVGITSGASTPESFLETVVSRLQEKGFADSSEWTVVEEDVRRFRLPSPLQDDGRDGSGQ